MRLIDLRSATTLAVLLTTALSVEAQDVAEGGLEEVTVTAQRREETLQDAAIALDVIDMDKLTRAGMESAQDLGRISPSLGVAAGGGPLTSLFVRGVGANTVNPLFDAGVAQNFDGVYLGRPAAASGLSFYDMERIELLKGPQGTLYGRNATGGVVNYIPVKPSIGETSGYAQIDVGNFGKIGGQGALNIAAGESSAFRVSGNFLERDPYADDGLNDAESYSLRAQFLTDLSENASLRVAVDHSDVSGTGVSGDLIGLYNNNGFAGPLTDFTPSGFAIDSGATSDAANALSGTVLAGPAFAFLPPIGANEIFQELTYTGVLAEFNYETDSGTLTFIPAYREADQDYTFIGPRFGPAPAKENHEQFTAELRFATELDSPFNGVFGAFYFDEDIDFDGTFNQSYIAPIQNFKNGGDSWAVFADGTFDVSDTFRLNAGVRYTDDEKYVDGTTHTFILFCGGAPAPGGGFTTPPGSFALGCQNQMPFPTVTNPDDFINSLIASGVIPPGSTAQDGFYPVINGIPGAIIDVDGPGGVSLVNTVSDDEMTYRFGFEWDAAQDSFVYASYARGYRAGGVDISQVQPTYPPEYIDAFTFGSKNRFLDNTVQLNIELFYWEYEDQQINYFATIGGGPAFPTASAESTIQGVDIDLIWAASDATTIGVKAQFLDSTYDRLDLVSDPGTGRYGCASSGVNGAGLEVFDCSGQNLVYSPETALDLSIGHIFELGNFELHGYLDVRYRDDQNTDNSFLPELIAESHTLLDLEFALRPTDGNWTVSAYGRNLSDERYFVSTNVSRFGPFHGIYSPPRTYGVRFGIEF
mgnify:FL=1